MDSHTLGQTSSMPAELSGKLPRTIQLSDGNEYVPVIIAVLFALAVIGSLWYGKHAIHEMRQSSALHQDGVDAPGEIMKLGRAGRGPDVISYTFAANGRTFSGMTEVPPDLVQSLSKSNTVAVRYIPSNPTINHPSAWEWSLSSEWLLIFMLLGFGSVPYTTWMSYSRDRRVAAYGTPAVGTVTKCQTSGRGRIRIKYEFHTAAGTPIKGIGYSNAIQEIGAAVWVLYLPQNPERSVPYPVPGYLVEQ